MSDKLQKYLADDNTSIVNIQIEVEIDRENTYTRIQCCAN